MSYRLLALAVLSTALTGCPEGCGDGLDSPSLSRRCDAPALRDSLGRTVVLRGASLSAESKWAADQLPPYDLEDLERLERDFGMNAVRLLVFWEAVEPLPGIYDDAYLEALGRWVDQAGELGLHVVVDMHQDVYGRGFGHAGAPEWSCDTELYATFQPQEPWFLGYLQGEVGECFDRLYEPGPTRSAFVAAWARVAQTLRNTDTEIVYEVLNEPFWGSSSAAEFEREVLTGLYREVMGVVRDVDRDARFLLQPSPATNVGVPTELAIEGADGVAYGPHFYPAAVELGSGYDGDEQALQQQMATLCSDAERLQMPLIVGELGVRNDVQGAAAYLRDMYDALDDAQASTFFWSYERGSKGSYAMLDRDGSPSQLGRMVARPYPRRVAGTPIRWRWDSTGSTFTAEWEEDDSALGETLIALPRLAFPHGVVVDLERGGTYFIEDAVLRIPPIGGHRQLVVKPRPTIAQREDPDPTLDPRGE